MILRRKFLIGLATAAAGTIGLGGTAHADHAHFVIITHPVTGETTCQYLAGGRSEPASNHPLHTLVHTGTPGNDDHGTDFDKEINESSRGCDTVRGQ